jgi:hypothetical protein
MRNLRQRVATIALTLAAATALFAPAANADTSPTAATVGTITYTSHYWPSAVSSPSAMDSAWQSASATSYGGYCNSGVTLKALDNVSNAAVCGSGAGFISHVVVPFTTGAAGSWDFQFGGDYGNGSEMLVDGTVVATNWYNVWNPSVVFDYTANLSAGQHTVEIYGAEDCCSGAWGARYQAVGASTWTTFATTKDSTAPVITAHVSPAAPDGANGWYTSSPSVSFDVTDPDSAVTDRSAGCDGGTVSSDTDGVTYECTATSAGGSDTRRVTIQRDATAPTATFDSPSPADGVHYAWGSVAAAPTCTATDAVSGPDGCAVTGYSTDTGTHTLVATATDKAGNTGSAGRTYTVDAWRTTGFTAPIDMGGVFNTVKNGSTVPAKFTVYAGDAKVTDTSKVALSAARVTCDAGATEDALGLTATGATSLRYDATAGQFVYNWATPKTAGACYALTMTAADGTTARALFKLK